MKSNSTSNSALAFNLMVAHEAATEGKTLAEVEAEYRRIEKEEGGVVDWGGGDPSPDTTVQDLAAQWEPVAELVAEYWRIDEENDPLVRAAQEYPSVEARQRALEGFGRGHGNKPN